MNKIAYNTSGSAFGLSKAAIQWLGSHGIYNKYPGIENLDNLPRHEPLLIKCIEELGEDAAACYAELAIAEIESDTYYLAVDSEGYETVITPENMIKIQQ